MFTAQHTILKIKKIKDGNWQWNYDNVGNVGNVVGGGKLDSKWYIYLCIVENILQGSHITIICV